MNEDDDQHLSLVIRGHLEARANPKEPVDVHALAEFACSPLQDAGG